MKLGRQDAIREIISEQDIETQTQLMQALADRGIKSTQATLSRDIRDLRLVKQRRPDGSSRYVLGEQPDGDVYQRLRAILREGVRSIDYAQNLLVIKTLPGLAGTTCAVIDSMRLETLVGSLAGDDTVFLAMKSEKAAIELCHQIEGLLFE